MNVKKVKEGEELESRSELVLGRVSGEASQPKQSVECKMKLEKKSGITYGQPQGQPLGVWGSAEVEAQQLGYGEMTIRGHKNHRVGCAQGLPNTLLHCRQLRKSMRVS